MYSAKDLMTPRPIFVSEDDTLRHAINEMVTADVRHMPVVDRDGELVGMLSERDVHELVAAGPGSSGRLDAKLRDVLPNGIVTVNLDTDVVDVIELMLESRYGAVPVVGSDGKSLKGIVSYIDILRTAQDLFERP